MRCDIYRYSYIRDKSQAAYNTCNTVLRCTCMEIVGIHTSVAWLLRHILPPPHSALHAYSLMSASLHAPSAKHHKHKLQKVRTTRDASGIFTLVDGRKTSPATLHRVRTSYVGVGCSNQMQVGQGHDKSQCYALAQAAVGYCILLQLMSMLVQTWYDAICPPNNVH